MKLSKLAGLKLLTNLNFNVIKFIENRMPTLEEYNLFKKWSVRTSLNSGPNVFLPSVHNVEDLNILDEFFRDKKDNYDIIIHRTVSPQIIGTVVGFIDSNYVKTVVCETFLNFEDRARGKFQNKYVWNILNSHILLRSVEGHRESSFESLILEEISLALRLLGFYNFNLEFVIENNQVLYTDLSTL